MQILKDFLNSEEIRYRNIYQKLTPSHPCILRDIQSYSYENNFQIKDGSTVIICIGSNYGTGPNQVNTCLTYPCESNLKQWKSNYIRMTNFFSVSPNWRSDWCQHSWCSNPFPALNNPNNNFFVMTNLCPWVTSVDWGALCPNAAKQFLAASAPNGQFQHLMSLFQFLHLNKISFVVLGHGINDNIAIELLNYLQANHQMDPWLQYANLTRSFTPKRWDIKKGRFVF